MFDRLIGLAAHSSRSITGRRHLDTADGFLLYNIVRLHFESGLQPSNISRLPAAKRPMLTLKSSFLKDFFEIVYSRLILKSKKNSDGIEIRNVDITNPIKLKKLHVLKIFTT